MPELDPEHTLRLLKEMGRDTPRPWYRLNPRRRLQMGAWPTGIAEMDALPVQVSKVQGDISRTGKGSVPETVEQLREALLFLGVEACDNGGQTRPGFVVSVPTPEVIGTTVVAVSPDLLQVLGYTDKAAYQAALNQQDFIHPADLLSAQAHVTHGITAPYKLRLKRGDDPGYLRMVVRGITVTYRGGSYRITVLRREG